jgi:hypothetical protein
VSTEETFRDEQHAGSLEDKAFDLSCVAG